MAKLDGNSNSEDATLTLPTEWARARDVIEKCDERIHDIRTKGLTFVTGLLTAQAVLGLKPGSEFSRALAIAVLAFSLVVVLGVRLFEKHNELLAAAAAARCHVIEGYLATELTETITYRWTRQKWPLFIWLLYASFGTLALIFYGATSPFHIERAPDLEHFAAICLFLGFVLLLSLLSWLDLRQPNVGGLDWSLSKVAARPHDVVEIRVTNMGRCARRLPSFPHVRAVNSCVEPEPEHPASPPLHDVLLAIASGERLPGESGIPQSLLAVVDRAIRICASGLPAGDEGAGTGGPHAEGPSTSFLARLRESFGSQFRRAFWTWVDRRVGQLELMIAMGSWSAFVVGSAWKWAGVVMSVAFLVTALALLVFQFGEATQVLRSSATAYPAVALAPMLFGRLRVFDNWLQSRHPAWSYWYVETRAAWSWIGPARPMLWMLISILALTATVVAGASLCIRLSRHRTLVPAGAPDAWPTNWRWGPWHDVYYLPANQCFVWAVEVPDGADELQVMLPHVERPSSYLRRTISVRAAN